MDRGQCTHHVVFKRGRWVERVQRIHGQNGLLGLEPLQQWRLGVAFAGKGVGQFEAGVVTKSTFCEHNEQAGKGHGRNQPVLLKLFVYDGVTTKKIPSRYTLFWSPEQQIYTKQYTVWKYNMGGIHPRYCGGWLVQCRRVSTGNTLVLPHCKR